MRKPLSVLTALAFTLWPLAARAHDGHAHVQDAALGTVAKVEGDRLDVADPDGKSVSNRLTATTTYLRGAEEANPDVSRLDRSEELLTSIRSAAAERDGAALASATVAYVSYLSVLRDEIGRVPRADGPVLPDKLAVGRMVALQATQLDSLAKALPRRLRKDVERALAAADGLLETLARGWSSPVVRPEPDGHAGRGRSTAAPSGGHH